MRILLLLPMLAGCSLVLDGSRHQGGSDERDASDDANEPSDGGTDANEPSDGGTDANEPSDGGTDANEPSDGGFPELGCAVIDRTELPRNPQREPQLSVAIREGLAGLEGVVAAIENFEPVLRVVPFEGEPRTDAPVTLNDRPPGSLGAISIAIRRDADPAHLVMVVSRPGAAEDTHLHAWVGQYATGLSAIYSGDDDLYVEGRVLVSGGRSSGNGTRCIWREHELTLSAPPYLGAVDPSGDSGSYGRSAELAGDALEERFVEGASSDGPLVVIEQDDTHLLFWDSSAVGTTAVQYGMTSTVDQPASDPRTGRPALASIADDTYLLAFPQAGQLSVEVRECAALSCPLSGGTAFEADDTEWRLPAATSIGEQGFVAAVSETNEGRSIVGAVIDANAESVWPGGGAFAVLDEDVPLDAGDLQVDSIPAPGGGYYVFAAYTLSAELHTITLACAEP